LRAILRGAARARSEWKNFSRIGWQRQAHLISCIVVRTVSRRALPAAAALAAAAVLLPGGPSVAQTVRSQPSLSSLVAQARQLSNEVDSLGQQYDGLQIQLAHARSEVTVAKRAAQRAEAAMDSSQRDVAQLATLGYMSGGLDPTLQMLTSGNPDQFLGQASTLEQLDNEAGMRVSTLQHEQTAATRAQVTAREEIASADQIQAQIDSKVTSIKSKLAILNSAAMTQAMAVFDKTGSYPDIVLPEATTVGTTALRAALTQTGKPYVWGAAGPDSYDCSGLVMWAFAQEGISLPHYTGAQWNAGMHVSRADLEPGDLVFFFADISHVGIYIGNGLMVDAPSAGQDVQVQPVFWGAYVGAVRIA
jgi:peptidoglycan DL-endopeptidase CwlO